MKAALRRPSCKVMTRMLCLLLLTFAAHQVAAVCKNCTLSKEERTMFLAHSGACLPQSGVEPASVDGLLRGEALDSPQLRSHVYCVLLRCKMITKDGNIQKNAVLGKMARGRNATKMMERCANQSEDSPEDRAWRLFRCGYDTKAVLFHHTRHQ